MWIQVKTWERMVELIRTMPHPVGQLIVHLQEDGTAAMTVMVRGRPDGTVLHILSIDNHMITRLRYDDIAETLFQEGFRVQKTLRWIE